MGIDKLRMGTEITLTSKSDPSRVLSCVVINDDKNTVYVYKRNQKKWGATGYTKKRWDITVVAQPLQEDEETKQ